MKVIFVTNTSSYICILLSFYVMVKPYERINKLWKSFLTELIRKDTLIALENQLEWKNW